MSTAIAAYWKAWSLTPLAPGERDNQDSHLAGLRAAYAVDAIGSDAGVAARHAKMELARVEQTGELPLQERCAVCGAAPGELHARIENVSDKPPGSGTRKPQ